MEPIVIPKSKLQGRRISRQLCRAATILEVLHGLPGASTGEVHAIVSDVLPYEVCKRTVHRDLDALYEAGFVKRRVARYSESASRAMVIHWEIETPVELRERIRSHQVKRGA